MVKEDLRRKLKAKRDSVPQSERALFSAELCALLRSMPEYKAASLVLLYYPTGSEPDLLPLAASSAEEGKTVAFPAVRDGDVRFFASADTSGFRPGAMGIPEPAADERARITDYSGAFCVVPALAADKRGIRLGYGGGYYDRFLSGFSGFSVCALFPGFYLDRLPAEPHDIPVNSLAAADKGIIRVNKK